MQSQESTQVEATLSQQTSPMYAVKRDGKLQEVNIEKIRRRLLNHAADLD